MDIGECDEKGLRGHKLFLVFVDNAHGEFSLVCPLKRATGDAVASALVKLIPKPFALITLDTCCWRKWQFNTVLVSHIKAK